MNCLPYSFGICGMYMKFPMFSKKKKKKKKKKKEPHRSSISEVIDPEICAYINA